MPPRNLIIELTETAIEERLRQAMKSRAAGDVSVLRMLLAAIRNARIERRLAPGEALPSADIVQIVRREMKQREEAIDFAQRGGRIDLAEKNRLERDRLEELLPQAPARSELEAAVRRHHQTGAGNIGALMGKLKEEFGPRLDAKAASEVVREFLGAKGGA